VSKQRAKDRAAREREARVKTAARGSAGERHERTQAARKPVGKKPAKQSRPRTPASKKRSHAPVGRPDGPLARRRRFRIRLLLVLLLVVNVAAGVIWQDWSVTLAVLIVSVITTPLLAALLLRRR
jgi:hypothetical protein